jgi:drug/metabolite transporter (DMT)-like permease
VRRALAFGRVPHNAAHAPANVPPLPPMTELVAGQLLAFMALILFSSNVVLTKVASARIALDAGFLVAVAANIVFAALLLGAQAAWSGPPGRLDWTGVALYAAAGAFTTWLGRWFFFEAIARLGPARASVFQVSSPLFTALIAWIALDERLGLSGLAGMAATVAGLVLVSVAPRSLARAPGAAVVGGRGLLPLLRSGLALGLASSGAYGFGNVLRGAAIRRFDEPVLGALLGAGAAMLLHLAITRGDPAARAALRRAPRSGVIMFAVSGSLTITAQMCTIMAMRHVPVALVALITLCTPVVVFPASYFLLRNQERITGRTVAGGTLALLGMGLLLW